MFKRSLLTAVAAAAAVAGCGSTNPAASQTADTSHSEAVAFATCMRSHGVPNFPDPKSSGGGDLRVQASPNGTAVNGVAVNGPAFQSAMRTCHAKLPGGGHGPPLSAGRRHAMLQFSQCMRAHGVTNFPDPTFNGGGARLEISRGSGLDPSSPAFKSAQQACGAQLGKLAPRQAP